MVVLKDTQMLAALIAAFGLVAWFRLVGRKVPLWLAAAAGVLLLHATLARANAVFVTAPLGILLIQRHPKLGVSLLGSAATIAVVLGLSPLVNHRLFGATDSGVAKSQALFDLAAIAVNTPPGTPSLFSPAERRQLVERHCVKAFFWDPAWRSVGVRADHGPVGRSARAGPVYRAGTGRGGAPDRLCRAPAGALELDRALAGRSPI